jgi:hypothetical protein
MKIKNEKGHEKTDPEKPVFKKRLSLMKEKYIRLAGKTNSNTFLLKIKSGKAGATTRKRINLP